MKPVLQTLVQHQENRFANAFDPVKYGMLTRLNIIASRITTDRSQRLAMFADLFSLPSLDSTKDLTCAQAMAFIRLGDNERFQQFLKDTYGSPQQEPL